jgi:hypothetical protein
MQETTRSKARIRARRICRCFIVASAISAGIPQWRDIAVSPPAKDRIPDRHLKELPGASAVHELTGTEYNPSSAK